VYDVRITVLMSKLYSLAKNIGAGVNCEPWFTGSPEICELRKNVNHNSKFARKMSELGSQKLSSQNFGSRTLFVNMKKILLKNM
jgi:hypothetical protein